MEPDVERQLAADLFNGVWEGSNVVQIGYRRRF